jgi:hypothetical protein
MFSQLGPATLSCDLSTGTVPPIDVSTYMPEVGERSDLDTQMEDRVYGGRYQPWWLVLSLRKGGEGSPITATQNPVDFFFLKLLFY